MDGSAFDRHVRAVMQARSRRGALLGLVGGAFGLLGVTATEAKHHKKKKKKKGNSPPASPPGAQCPASCPICQECINGESCTVQSDFTPCGDSSCKLCQGGVCVNRSNNASCGDNNRCHDGVCTRSCTDGLKNGDESDVDCGGSCDRCANGKTCNSRDDCQTALCVGGHCTTCQIDSNCGSDAAGACTCYNEYLCYSSGGVRAVVGACPSACPAGTGLCVPNGGAALCYPYCGTTF